MNREYTRWYSPILKRDMEALVFGQGGYPILAFPDVQGRFFQYEDCGIIAALLPGLEEGRFQIFCVDSLDAESWCNADIAPARRIQRHEEFEAYIVKEFIPFIRKRNRSTHSLTVNGCGFGGYHAVNFSFRHPEMVKRVVGIGGTYDISGRLDGFYDPSVYFNSPFHFLPELNDEWYLFYLRNYMEIWLADGEKEESAASALGLSAILTEKQIPHGLDLWGPETGHDWADRRRMIQKFVV